MSRELWPNILPYSYVVGQTKIKRALELNYVAPRIGGVLIAGDRGTAKSTIVRAFALMVYGQLPVTLPINATDDRILGGWRLDELMEGRVIEQKGLLEVAGERGVLYIDEVNLLDDHVVNIILDVSSTGILNLQREGTDKEIQVGFGVVGTMNPDEGGVRPQLLDRFGLTVEVHAEQDPVKRREILQTILKMDEASVQPVSDFLERGRAADKQLKLRLDSARDHFYEVKFDYQMATLCAEIAAAFQAAGHRGDVVTALAARALAALEFVDAVDAKHVVAVAPLALQHRRKQSGAAALCAWGPEDQRQLEDLVKKMSDL